MRYARALVCQTSRDYTPLCNPADDSIVGQTPRKGRFFFPLASRWRLRPRQQLRKVVIDAGYSEIWVPLKRLPNAMYPATATTEKLANTGEAAPGLVE